jgi:hypothetical protein
VNGFEREMFRAGKTLPDNVGTLRAGNTANIAGFYFLQISMLDYDSYGSFFLVINKQSV